MRADALSAPTTDGRSVARMERVRRFRSCRRTSSRMSSGLLECWPRVVGRAGGWKRSRAWSGCGQETTLVQTLPPLSSATHWNGMTLCGSTCLEICRTRRTCCWRMCWTARMCLLPTTRLSASERTRWSFPCASPAQSLPQDSMRRSPPISRSKCRARKMPRRRRGPPSTSLRPTCTIEFGPPARMARWTLDLRPGQWPMPLQLVRVAAGCSHVSLSGSRNRSAGQTSPNWCSSGCQTG
mmetsp:Transcript_6363/g.18626  ORF Transcript_6363/g.18626 Transcript_6363/m.18626 type:complete len:239 (+) Transcript_6363:473-1189(+)